VSRSGRPTGSPVLTLRRILISGSVLLLVVGVVIARGAARSIRKPVVAMTAAAERLAHGRLVEPIAQAGEDEIGRLSVALEKLRQALEGDERRSLLLKRVLSAQEEERRRIARELHDETTQQLTALGLQLEMAAQAHPPAAGSLDGARTLVASMVDDLHRVIYDLRPSMLDDLGLLPAIRWYADRHLAAHGISVHYECPDTMPALPPEARTALYRAAQEAIANIERHARADSVLLECTVTPETVTIEIEDNGIGFDPARVQRPRESGEGLGLLGMRERLALIGGRCIVESEPGGGTHVTIALPLHA
jgi:signal transduction histidine kinase